MYVSFPTCKSLHVFLFLLINVYPNAGRTQPVSYIKYPAEKFNAFAWSYYKTDSAQLSITDIQACYSSGQFKPLKQAILNAGISDHYYWIHFVIAGSAKAQQPVMIEIENSRLNALELFEVQNNTAQSLGKAGDFYPFSQRAILHKNFIYPVSPDQHKEYFLFVNQIGHTFTLPVKIFTLKDFRTATFTDYLFDGVTYGILLFVAVMSLLFFLTSGHRLYFYYGLYIITTILWFLSYFGLGYQYIWGDYPGINTSMAPCMAAINILLNLQICQVLLQLPAANRWLNKMAGYTKIALTAVALFPFFFSLNRQGYAFNHAYLIAFLFTILFGMTIVSFSVILYAIKGFNAARVYLIASLLKAVSIINLALLELGITPAFFNMEGLLQMGIFIEITLLTYALARRYTVFKARTFEKVIEAHEKERFLISKEIHDCISNSLTGINYGIMNFTRNTEHLPAQKLQLEKIFNELNKVQLEARNISHNTMPDYIKSSVITDIVEKYIAEMQNKVFSAKEETILQINFSANEQLINFSEAVKLNIFRITQELVTNTLKHSKASIADLIFSFGKRELTIIAEDNGIGFHEDGKKEGMGIKNIRSRVELLDGSISISSPVYKKASEPGNTTAESQILPYEYGTMIRIKIPYRDNLSKKSNGYDY